MTETIFGENLFDVYFDFLVWPKPHLLTWRGWDLWPILGPATMGRSRCFGFTFGELSCRPSLYAVYGFDMHIVKDLFKFILKAVILFFFYMCKYIWNTYMTEKCIICTLLFISGNIILTTKVASGCCALFLEGVYYCLWEREVERKRQRETDKQNKTKQNLAAKEQAAWRLTVSESLTVDIVTRLHHREALSSGRSSSVWRIAICIFTSRCCFFKLNCKQTSQLS